MVGGFRRRSAVGVADVDQSLSTDDQYRRDFLFLLCQLGLTRFKLFATNAFRREKGVIFSMESGYGKTLYDQQ